METIKSRCDAGKLVFYSIPILRHLQLPTNCMNCSAIAPNKILSVSYSCDCIQRNE